MNPEIFAIASEAYPVVCIVQAFSLRQLEADTMPATGWKLAAANIPIAASASLRICQ